MGLFHVAYNGYVWKALFLYRHPERSRGIFLAHQYSAVCVIAENGNASAKGIRKRGKGETFCERSKKEQSARKISRCARNDGMGEWVYFTQRTTDMLGKRYSCIVIPTEVEESFLQEGIMSYV